jgi:hypothetical protein
MLKQSKDEKLDKQSTFVFKGTVKKLKAATLANVPVTDKTIIVRADEVLRGPDALAHYEGTDITVQLGSREQAKKGEQALFYTNSWLIGEGLAVQSVGHISLGAGSASAQSVKSARSASKTGGEEDRSLQEEVASADTVITGKVISVRVVDEPAGGTASGLSAADKFQPISEHSPVWQEAVIEVTDVERGTDIPKQIVVRFPSSSDVRWYDAPKFRPGQEGVFLLKKESKKKKTAAATRSRARATTAKQKAGTKLYTAMGAASFQPLQKVETIRTLIKAAQ